MLKRFIPALVFCFAGTARANDWYVDQSFANCPQSDGTISKPYCTIGGAVAVAASGDTIHIAPGTYFERVVVNFDLNFVGSQGASTTILDGAGKRTLMGVNPNASVTFTGLTFHAAYLPPSFAGSAISADHASVALADCVVDSCESPILVSYGALTIDRCTMSGNTSQLHSGGITTDDGPVAIHDSLFENNHGPGGALLISRPTSTASIERCVFRGNHATPTMANSGKGGGASLESVSMTDCLFEANVAEGCPLFQGGWGGAAVIWGDSLVTRCRFVGNTADPKNAAVTASYGGALWIPEGTVTLVDCSIVDNYCGSAINGLGGLGGGVMIDTLSSARVDFVRCTIAGNRADGLGNPMHGGTGGGIWLNSPASMARLEGTIVADNFAGNPGGAPDIAGTVTTNDYNVIGSTMGLRLLGSGPNDLLDVDPLLTDPANGDDSLQPTSPCIDSGDPIVAPGGLDIAGVPRVLDGNLDRVMVLDRGAREFDNVLFTVTGQATPGGALTFDTSGTSGLALLMIVGVAEKELIVRPLGSLFVDLASPFDILPWGTIPNSQTISIDPSFPTPTALMLQELALSGRSGNLSNFMNLTIQ